MVFYSLWLKASATLSIKVEAPYEPESTSDTEETDVATLLKNFREINQSNGNAAESPQAPERQRWVLMGNIIQINLRRIKSFANLPPNKRIICISVRLIPDTEIAKLAKFSQALHFFP